MVDSCICLAVVPVVHPCPLTLSRSSPHLVQVRERIRINGQPIGKELFTKYFWQVFGRLEKTKVGVCVLGQGWESQRRETSSSTPKNPSLSFFGVLYSPVPLSASSPELLLLSLRLLNRTPTGGRCQPTSGSSPFWPFTCSFRRRCSSSYTKHQDTKIHTDLLFLTGGDCQKGHPQVCLLCHRWI